MRKLLLCLPLLACTPLGPHDPSTAPKNTAAKPAIGGLIGGSAPEDCGAGSLSSLVGQPVSALPGTGPWGTLRIIRPGMAVTQDYSASRLNVTVDGTDRIERLSCG